MILSTRGLIEGKDSFPVFHVNPTSTLAHTVAKLVATRSHRYAETSCSQRWREANYARLWVTDPLSPSSSGPPTPSHSSAHIPLAASTSSATTGSNTALSPPPSPLPTPISLPTQSPDPSTPHLPAPPQPYGSAVPFPPVASSGVTPPLASSIPASSLPGARLSGRLVGVVSLTDILNLHARASGLSPADPAESRRRRRSSSSSMSVRRSGEIGRELFSRGGV